MIDILFIENSIGLSGSTLSLCTLLNYLDSDEYEAHIVLSRPEQETYLLGNLRRPGPLTVITPRRSLKLSVTVERMLERLGDRRPWLRRLVLRFASCLDVIIVTIPYAWRLYQWAKDRRIKLVHQNNGFDLGSLLLARMLRVPLIAYQRGDEWNSPVVRRLARGVRRFIANSETTKQNLIALGIPAARISVLNPPLDLETLRLTAPSRVTKDTFGVEQASPCFGIVGMLLPWKGHQVFLKAAQRVFQQIPNAWALVIGGAPHRERNYEDDLHALAKDLGIADRVVFTGFRTDVPDMLRLVDVVVHASITPEPFGRVIAEAMAMKRPVIATSAGGPTEIIEDGRTGFLVPPGDDVAMAERIIDLLLDPALAQRIAEAGYREARERFAGDAHARRVQQIYDIALERRDRRRTAAGPDSGRRPAPQRR